MRFVSVDEEATRHNPLLIYGLRAGSVSLTMCPHRCRTHNRKFNTKLRRRRRRTHTHTNRHPTVPIGIVKACRRTCGQNTRPLRQSASVSLSHRCVSVYRSACGFLLCFFLLFFEQKINEHSAVWLAWEELLMLTYP